MNGLTTGLIDFFALRNDIEFDGVEVNDSTWDEYCYVVEQSTQVDIELPIE